MGDKRDKIIERIKKLFELANDKGATEGEAIAAALKAQKLIAEYDIDEFELQSEDGEQIREIESEPANRKWRWHLAEVVADNFRCRFYQNKRWGKRFISQGRRDSVMVFYGYDQDARAAAMTFNYLYRIGDKLASKRSRDRLNEVGSSYGVYNMYVCGFVDGVASELEKQAQALMIVVPPKVNDSFNEKAANIKEASVKSLTLQLSLDYKSYESGFSDGKDAIRSHRIEEPHGNETSVEQPLLMT